MIQLRFSLRLIGPNRDAYNSSLECSTNEELNKRGGPWARPFLFCASMKFLFLCVLCAFVVNPLYADQRNLILFTIDTLRSDYLSCNGSTKVQTPNLDRLANGGANFLQVRTSVPLTLPAHTSIMTGLYPPEHGVRDNGTYVLAKEQTTLAKVLKKQGYSTAAFVGSFILDHRFGLAQGFDFYDDQITQDLSQLENLDAERNAGAVDAAFTKWLAQYKSTGPLFLWIHLYDPHAPYVPPEPYKTKYQQNPYAGEVAYADAIVGKIIQQLQVRKLTDNSMIAVVGDHGEALGEHEETTHSVLIYNATLHVPMLIYAPGLVKPGAKIEALCRTIDLAPTLLEYLNIPDKLGEGISFKATIEQKAPPPYIQAYSESLYARFNLGWSELHGIEKDNYHYILSPRPELYDTQKDPAELNNLIQSLPKVAKDLRQTVEKMQPAAPSKSQALDEETKEKLSSLGYVSGSTPAAKASNVNPRDKMPVSHKIQIGVAQFTQHDFQSAAKTFQNLLETEKDIPLIYQYLGTCLTNLGRLDEAEAVYESALKRGIDSAVIRLNLGIVELQQKKYDSAQAELTNAIKMDRLNVTAYDRLGDLLRYQGKFDQAILNYEKAIEINPDYIYALNGLGMSYVGLKDDTNAVKYFQEAIKRAPQNPIGYFNIAVEYERIGRSDEALNAYKKFLSLNTDQDSAESRKRAADAIRRLETKN
ncbi:MAG: hypothetical protein C5B54_12265 [Acidobacteria bacterium]|nr:MAG: hypothetical protein C5B54_12265 [Acidobacteriota bacterium]